MSEEIYNNFEFYKDYKPLRNHLRKVDVWESLYVIWAFNNHILKDNKFPTDIDVPSNIVLEKDRVKKGIYTFQLEVLTRELLAIAEETTKPRKTFRRWDYFAPAVNKLRGLYSNVDNKCTDTSNVLYEMFRLVHQQFPSQEALKPEAMTRYYKIFSYKPLEQLITKKLGLPLNEIYTLALVLLGRFMNHHNFLITPEYDLTEFGIDENKKQIFLDHISCSLEEAQSRLLDTQTFDCNFKYYGYETLKAFPLIKNDDMYYCPLIHFYFDRFTTGLYYEIFKEKDFDDNFGHSYQEYVGEVLKKVFPLKQVKMESKYKSGKGEKRTIDWILDSPNTALFIECKAKRLPLIAKFTDIKNLEEEIEIMAKYVVQMYKTLLDYKKNLYPNYKYNSKKDIYLVLVTLEDWRIAFNINSQIDSKVQEMFKKEKIPESLLDEYPYLICSISDFENFIQIAKNVGLDEYMSKTVKNLKKYRMKYRPFQLEEYEEEKKKIKFLFQEDFDQIFQKKSKDEQ